MGKRITCLVCNKKFGDLRHHLRVHGLTADEYLKKYPNADIRVEGGLTDGDRRKLGYLVDIFVDPEDRKWLSRKYNKYTFHLSIEKEYDKDDLLKLLSLEMRYKQLLEIEQEPLPNNGKPGSAVSDKDFITEKTRALEQIMKLKQALNITKVQREDEGKDQSVVGFVENLKKSAYEYQQSHKSEFTWRCPYCGKMCLLNKKHFAFDGENRVWNDDLVDLVVKGRITRKEAAKVLRTSAIAIRRLAEGKGIRLPKEEGENIYAGEA